MCMYVKFRSLAEYNPPEIVAIIINVIFEFFIFALSFIINFYDLLFSLYISKIHPYFYV